MAVGPEAALAKADLFPKAVATRVYRLGTQPGGGSPTKTSTSMLRRSHRCGCGGRDAPPSPNAIEGRARGAFHNSVAKARWGLFFMYDPAASIRDDCALGRSEHIPSV